MAKLTERLALTEGTNRVIDDPAGPSAVGALADFVSQSFDSYEQLRADMAVNKEKAKKAEEKATQAAIAYDVTGAPERALSTAVQRDEQIIAGRSVLDNLAKNLAGGDVQVGPSGTTSDASGNVFAAPPADMPVSAQREVSSVTGRATSIVAAVEQGKMPRITIEAALNADFRRMREKYPQHAEYIMDMYKKAGIDSSLFTELQDAKDQREYEREAGQQSATSEAEFRRNTINEARVALGEDSIGMDDNALFTRGLKYKQSAYNLDLASKTAATKLQEAQATGMNRDEIEKDLNLTIEKEFGYLGFVDSATYVGFANKLADAMMKDPNNPEHAQRWQLLGVKVNQKIGTFVEASVTAAQANGYTGDLAKLRTNLEAKFQPMRELFQGDFSVANASLTALKAIEATVKLDTAQALPFFMALKSAGLDPAKMPGMMKAIDGNPDLQERLNKEAKGFVDDWGKDRASVRIVNAIKILRGERALKDLSAGEAAKAIPLIVGTVRENAKGYNAGKIGDPEDIINGVGEIAVNLRSLGPSTSADLTYVATKGFADVSVRNALIKATTDPKVDKGELRATIIAARAGSAHLLNNMQLMAPAINRQNPGWNVVWDDKNGKYAIRRMALPSRVTTLDRFRGPGVKDPTTNNNRPVPTHISRFVDAANLNLDNAIDLGRVDPTTPKGTDLELRRWYGQNKPLKSQQDKPVDFNKEVDTMFNEFEGMLDKGIRSATDSSNVPAPAKPAPKELAPIISKAAQTHGVPERLANALIGKESSFVVGNKGPVIKSGTHAGDRAMGLGQVMAKTAAAYGVSDRSKLDAAGEADLSMRILADNFKSTGNWRDAVSMYFTGVSYDKAVKQGRSDGFNTVMQYVEDIME